MTACLVGALSLGSATSATAAPLPRKMTSPHTDARRGGPAWGRGRLSPRYRPVVGRVVTAPGTTAPTTFTMNVVGQRGTTTLVTVDVSTTTKLGEPGFSAPALANIMAGDLVGVMGTQAGTNTLAATSVWVLPPKPPVLPRPGAPRMPVINASLAPSLTSYPDLYGVPPGGANWSLRTGHVVVHTGGQLDATVTGLVLTSTGSNPLPQLAASLYCNGALAATTAPVPFSAAGNAHISSAVSVPSPCFVPAVLITIQVSGSTHYIAFDGTN